MAEGRPTYDELPWHAEPMVVGWCSHCQIHFVKRLGKLSFDQGTMPRNGVLFCSKRCRLDYRIVKACIDHAGIREPLKLWSPELGSDFKMRILKHRSSPNIARHHLMMDESHRLTTKAFKKTKTF